LGVLFTQPLEINTIVSDDDSLVPTGEREDGGIIDTAA
jgi:hypothetical protein